MFKIIPLIIKLKKLILFETFCQEIFRTKKIWMAAEVGFAVYDGHLLLASFIGSLGAVGIGRSGNTVAI